MNLKNCIEETITKVLLVWFYVDNEPVSIIRLYIQLNDIYLNILCSEEDVSVKKEKEFPVKIDVENFSYIPIEKNIDWLSFCKIKDIQFLVDRHNVKRGILFLFENNHNLTYYNEGYDVEDKGVFDIDVESLPYNLINVVI